MRLNKGEGETGRKRREKEEKAKPQGEEKKIIKKRDNGNINSRKGNRAETNSIALKQS